jgi:hypothetical protein
METVSLGPHTNSPSAVRQAHLDTYSHNPTHSPRRHHPRRRHRSENTAIVVRRLGRPAFGGAPKMWCQSCKEGYDEEDAGTCKECYEEASETEEELKREIDDLRSRLLFLRLPSPTLDAASAPNCDLLLHAIPSTGAGGERDAGRTPDTPAVPAHRVILVGPLSFTTSSFLCAILV